MISDIIHFELGLCFVLRPSSEVDSLLLRAKQQAATIIRGRRRYALPGSNQERQQWQKQLGR